MATISASLAVEGTADGQFNNPRGIATNSTHVLVADALNNRIQIFDLPPAAAISASANNGGVTNSNTISYTATFNEDVMGFDVTDITVTGTAFGDSSSSEASNFDVTGDTYTFDVQTSSDGTVIVSLPAHAATDTHGNPSLASLPYTVTVDTVAPTVVITSTVVDDDSIETSETISYTAMFGEDVTGFGDTADDIMLSGTAAASVSALTRTDSTTYTFVVTVITDGTVTVSIPEDAAADAAGNGNAASDTNIVTLDTDPCIS